MRQKHLKLGTQVLVIKLGFRGTSTAKTPCFVHTTKIFKDNSLTNI